MDGGSRSALQSRKGDRDSDGKMALEKKTRGEKYFAEGFLLFLWAKKRFVPEERKNSFYSGKKGEKKAKKG